MKIGSVTCTPAADAAVQRSEEIIIAAAQDRRNLGRAARFGGADVGLRRVDLLVRRFDVGIVAERDRDRVLGGPRQVRQLRRRLQIDRRLADEADIAFAAGDQIGLGGAQIALRQREPCLGLGDVGARQVADLEPVARRLQIGAQDRDILLVELDDRLIADDVHIGADDLREDARLGRAKVGLPRLDAKFRRTHRIAHRPALIKRHGQLAAHRQRAPGRVEAVAGNDQIFFVARLRADVGKAVAFFDRDIFVVRALARARAGQRRVVFIRLGERPLQGFRLCRHRQQQRARGEAGKPVGTTKGLFLICIGHRGVRL